MRIPLFAFLLLGSSFALATFWYAWLLWSAGSGVASTVASTTICALLVLWLRWSMCGFIDSDLLFFKATSQRNAIDDAILQSQTKTAKLDVITVNLDLPPEKRWLHIIKPLVERGESEKMKALLVSQLVILFGKTGGIVLSLFMKVLLTAHARFCMPSYFRLELLGIAQLTSPRGLTYFDLLMLNYGGDFAANCTSGVVNSRNSQSLKTGKDTPVHLRNMDWFPQEDFRNLCYQIDMYRGGRLLFSSTSWLFIVGSYTVMRRGGEQNGAYSISMNFRLRDEGVHCNVLSILGFATAWPQGLLIRDCAECTAGYQAAVSRLCDTKLIAPCYFILSGCAPAQGVVVERSRNHADTIDELRGSNMESTQADVVDESKETERFVLVTNCDLRCKSLKLSWTHEDPLLMNALLRREAARRLFNRFYLQMQRNSTTDQRDVLQGACDVLSSDPVNNYQTVFGVVMIPRDDVIVSHSWPVSADSRKWDKRMVGGSYSDADLLSMRVVRD